MGKQINGFKPSRMPKPLEGVIFCHSDSDLIGAPVMQLPMIVTSVHGDGSVINGYLFLDPGAVVKGPEGEPKTVMELMISGGKFNPLVPVQGAPYGRGEKNTWHFAEEQFKRVINPNVLKAIKGENID